MPVLFGINPVVEALKAGSRSFDYVAVMAGRRDARAQLIFETARDAGVPVRQVSRDQLERLAGTHSHQGVVAVTSEKQYSDIEQVLNNKRGEHNFLVVLDGVEDPHNLGAIIRTADGAGADGVVIPERRAVGVTGTVLKASAGAAEHLPIARVTNVNRTLEDLKERNIWTIGLDERAKQSYDEIDYNMDCALVLGAEGSGLHDMVRKKCDFLISIPMEGHVPSLNVSVAAGVVMYEVLRQRRHPKSKKS
ncbi:MAG TPA: 23S rRNA (guanosine(2251)-2'-O)-methyltransferase RlmB [Terriglobales bacterium]|nr:23S rRNA (guanosine(2251)-2'-O)-methyltransferase RlmB [Terriglobales bacterium]